MRQAVKGAQAHGSGACKGSDADALVKRAVEPATDRIEGASNPVRSRSPALTPHPPTRVRAVSAPTPMRPTGFEPMTFYFVGTQSVSSTGMRSTQSWERS